jgi:hypothetical protein
VNIDDTIRSILETTTWAQRIHQIRLVPQRHGTGDHVSIYAVVARKLYMPHLAPDFAYIHDAPFYDTQHFFEAYDAADRLTQGFALVGAEEVARVIADCPSTLLVFRTLLGLTKEEFAHSTVLVAASAGMPPVTASVIDNIERTPVSASLKRPKSATARAKAEIQAQLLAETICLAMNGELYGQAPEGLRLKQDKPDTENGWESVRHFAREGVPLWIFLHQRHYGGAYRQILDATSTRRGDLIEDAVEHLFIEAGISFIRTGSHNQAEVAARFEVQVTPAPEFVVYDPADDGLRAMLECKGTNNGGTARDKSLRFARLRVESIRLGGVPLFAVLSGIGWARINDALAPVVRDTDGRVFTISTLTSMLEVMPFPSLVTRTPRSSPE